jgi:periplasmic protein TonB
MRTCMLLFSIAIHALVVVAIVVVTLVATDVLPEPRRAYEIVVVTPKLPDAPQVQKRVVERHHEQTAAPVSAAPVSAPDEVRPETGLEASPDRAVPIEGALSGIPGSVVAFGDPPPPSDPPPAPPAHTPPMRVGGVIGQPQKIRYVPPAYPPLAQASRVGGRVILEAVIGEDGAVRGVKVLRSIPLLDQAAVDAVRQWRFTPTTLNGQPVARGDDRHRRVRPALTAGV